MPKDFSCQVHSVLDQLARQLADISDSTIWVGFSGGIDSTVLLHAVMCHPALSTRVKAIHVNHGIHPQADVWQKHCCAVAERYSIDIQVCRIDSQPHPGQSVEAWARTERYAAFKSIVLPGDILLLAHHLNDQAETTLLRLFRGHGPTGLAAMPIQRLLSNRARLIRPLLTLSKAILQSYAIKHQLSWLNDDTNFDPRFDRNYIRHKILPDLAEHWPAIIENVARSAELCRHEGAIVKKWALGEIKQWQTQCESAFSIDKLGQHCESEQIILVRHWLHLKTGQYPSYQLLLEMFRTLIDAKIDAAPCIWLENWQIRRFKNNVYVLSEQQWSDVPDDYHVNWSGKQPLLVPGQLYPITKQLLKQQGLAVDQLDWNQVNVRFRKAGDRCRPFGRSHSQTVKKLLQEYDIPPWQRDRLPLIFCGGQIVMAVGVWVCHGFEACF